MSLGECQMELDAAREEADELRLKYLRAEAANENTRKQAERDSASRIAAHTRSFSAQLLEVVDNLERALKHAPEGDALRPGVQATLQQLLAALRGQGVTPIAVQPGAIFDPHVHEAIAGEPGDVPQDTVVEVAQNGYTIDGQLLRPARVVVALSGRGTHEPEHAVHP
jgi:molecular chaperone GrpE